MKSIRYFLAAIVCWGTVSTHAQSEFDEGQLGAWYMYFVQKQFEDSNWGIQGDYQFRFWDFGSDLEQVLLRTGVTYRPTNANVLFTAGYANITSGAFGESDATSMEHRIYQEALIPQKLGNRVLLTHRFRSEQRWVEGQDFRTRYRYNIFVNVPFNDTKLDKGVVYAALYNEIFINGETGTNGRLPGQYFDRNRSYIGVGYGILSNLRVQLGWMRQTTAGWAKNQAQVSLHHNF
ncbi:DUF2490 domain-containing protein [Phaeocystidibacter luteus]|uniref:DUF2490 domain-containing protein n=1 Tax=Phaeocystidibacter luteus TaxID=911197 RepID=A0A6N6RGM3_9FLAO|nr:DUF2490 domain-containing protein [Phaeocystidibacter luteus]KAB2807713.1 DUF2490 domain-containing protein [Phaeocystidibacter luteus]